MKEQNSTQEVRAPKDLLLGTLPGDMTAPSRPELSSVDENRNSTRMEEKTGRANAEQTVQCMRKCRRKEEKAGFMRRMGGKRGKEGRRAGGRRGGGGEKSRKGEDGAYNTSSKGSKGVVVVPIEHRVLCSKSWARCPGKRTVKL